MMDKVSILDTVKAVLPPNGDAFDDALLVFINAALGTVTQLGIGPEEGIIVDENTTWDALIGERKDLEMLKAYIPLKVKLQFDPPQNSFGLESIKELLKEYEWRLNINVDPDEQIGGS